MKEPEAGAERKWMNGKMETKRTPLEITLKDGTTKKEVEAVLMDKEPLKARAA